MKRRLTITAAALSLCLAASGCGIASDGVAATVGDVDITFDEVAGLASAEEIKSFTTEGLVSDGEGTTGSATRRTALSQLVQLVALEEWVDANGGATEADRNEARQQMQPTGSKEFERFMERYLTAYVAASRIVDGLLDGPEDEVRARLYDLIGPGAIGKSYCLEAVEADPTVASELSKLLGRDTELAEVDADSLGSAVPLTDGETCYTGLQLTGYLGPIDNAPLGSWYHEQLTLGGEARELFVKVASRAAASLEDETTLQFLDAIAAAPPQALSVVLYGLLERSDVVVDPRLGTWNSAQSAVVAPAVPRTPPSGALTDLEYLLDSMQ